MLGFLWGRCNDDEGVYVVCVSLTQKVNRKMKQDEDRQCYRGQPVIRTARNILGSNVAFGEALSSPVIY